MYPITFPNLGLEFNISPVALILFEKEIYWYGIIIAFGIIISLILIKLNIRKFEIKWDDVLDFLTIATIIGIISARIYFVIFKWDYYRLHLDEIIKIWNGRNCYLWLYYRRDNHCNIFLQEKEN
jgi:phosphatidylglycerol:prolipoprotein diacylglycerol transferase